MASIVIAQLLFLQSESNKKPIHMYINSPGGSVTAGLAIYDTMQYIMPPIATWCVGQAASMGSLLLAAGTPGLRHSLPHSRIMIHQPSGGVQVTTNPQREDLNALFEFFFINVLKCFSKGQATDILIHAEEIMKLKKQINKIYSKHTGKPIDLIGNLFKRFFVS